MTHIELPLAPSRACRTPLPAQSGIRRRFASLLDSVLVLGCFACGKSPSLPEPTSGAYQEVVRAFYTGLAALQVGDDARADTSFAAVTRLAPGEPAGWANWGVLALRQRDFDLAAPRLDRARSLAPQDGHIYDLLGMLDSNRGRSDQAIAHFRKAAELDAKNLRNAYALAQELERKGGPDSDAEFQKAIEQIVALDPDNLAAQLDLGRIAAKRGDAATLLSAIARISAAASTWPPEAQGQLQAVRSAANGSDLRQAALRTTLLRNVLWRVPEFRRSFSRLKGRPGEELQPYTRFVRLVSPLFKPAPPDTAIGFDVQAIAEATGDRWSWIGAIELASAGAPIVAWANAKELRLANGVTLPFPSGTAQVPPSPEGVLQVDFNYDFKTDIVLAGAGGVRFFRQESAGRFTDVATETKLPRTVLDGRYTGAWAADIEADGDLDIVLGSGDGIPLVLRNDGDGSFAPVSPFSGISGVRQFAWADLDGDGTPDAVIVDGVGRLHIFVNERQGQFR